MTLQKITKTGRAEDRRRYDDACAAAHGMDLIGERWSMPLIRELLFGPRRFSDLKASLNGISANVLTQRLEGLEAAGVQGSGEPHQPRPDNHHIKTTQKGLVLPVRK